MCPSLSPILLPKLLCRHHSLEISHSPDPRCRRLNDRKTGQIKPKCTRHPLHNSCSTLGYRTYCIKNSNRYLHMVHSYCMYCTALYYLTRYSDDYGNEYYNDVGSPVVLGAWGIWVEVVLCRYSLGKSVAIHGRVSFCAFDGTAPMQRSFD